MLKADRKKFVMGAAACVMAFGLSVGVTHAYFTSNESVTNTVTIGQVKITLDEPHYDGEKAKNLQPNQSIDKDPQIKNIGSNEALIFAEVRIPTEKLTLASLEDGTKISGTTVTDLFFFKKGLIGSDAEKDASTGNNTTNENSYNTDKWMQIKDFYEKADGTSSSVAVEGGNHVYVFALKEKLAPNVTSAAIFDRVQLQYIVEGTLVTEVNEQPKTYYVPIEGYAIQADSVLEGSADLTDSLTAENFRKIYNIYCRQNGKATIES